MECTNFDNEHRNVYVASYPATGAEWVVELVWLLVNNLDFENAKKPLEDRCVNNNVNLNNFAYFNGFVNTEMSYDLLFDQILNTGKQNKIIYVLRNPEKTCISLYHKQHNNLGDKTKLEKFCHLFLSGQVYSGSYWEHVSRYWLNAHSTQILFVHYECLLNRLPRVIKRVSDFLGKLLTEYDILSLVYHLCIPNLQKKSSFNSAIRTYDDITLSSELSRRFAEQNEYYHKKIGLNFE